MKAKTGVPTEEVLAEFDLAFHANSVHITVHARGGSASSGAQTNPGYEVLIQTLLERLKQADCVLQDVLLASKTVASLPRSQRRILLQDFDLPVPLSAVADVKDLRLAIRRAVMTSHSTSTVTTHGNATKRIELVASYPHSATEVAAFLEWGDFEASIIADEISDTIETRYFEGQRVLRSHLVRERNRALVSAAKSEFRSKYGRLYCEVCDFDFELKYGELGDGFIEAHHDIPLSQRDSSSETRIADLRMVCANCHRMLHRNFANNPVSIELLKTIMTADRNTN